MDIVKLLNYMENLRYDRKMTQEVYLDNVISQRQYYRYRSGESEVPFEVIVKFANKLQIPLLKLISSFQTYSEREKEIVTKYFNLVVALKLKEAKEFITKQRTLLLLDDETKVFFLVTKILHDFFLKKISNVEMVSRLKEHINFKETMKKEILHDIELYILGIIMEFSDEDREVVFSKIENLMKNNKLLLGSNPLLSTQVYFWIIKNLGRMNCYKEVIEISEVALEYSKKNYIYYLKEYFHYYKALAYYRTGQNDKFEEELFNTLLVLYQLDEHRRQHFLEIIKKDTEIDCKMFFIEKIENGLF